MKSVFILGAGASAHTGVPMMAEFLEVIEDLHSPGAPDAKNFSLTIRGRQELQAVHSKAAFDIDNLESVFAAFEMATLFGRLGDMDVNDVRKLGDAMRAAIVATIEARVHFEVRHNEKIQPSHDYSAFARLLKTLKARGDEVAVITFNYDIGVDFGLWANRLWVDYCLKPEAELGSSDEPVIELMKLHGSINWAQCSNPTCDGIETRLVRDIVHDQEAAWRREGGSRNKCRLRVDLSRNVEHCGRPCTDFPVIVPPTPEKGGLRQPMAQVWRRAAGHLRGAQNIFVIGYSWPRTDQFFHQLYALGSVGPTLLRNFWVVDPNPDVRTRFADELLGPQAKAKFGPHWNGVLGPLTFSRGIDAIARHFDVDANELRRHTQDREAP